MRKNIPYQIPNPSDSERHDMLKFFLQSDNRIEDFSEIIENLSPPKDILKICSETRGKGVKIAIIGAGIAGLCACYELKRIGCDLTVFEASNRIGGRIFTYYFDKKDMYGDLGAMRIPLSHETTWHYIKKFKLKTKPFISRSVSSLYYIRGSYADNSPSGQSIIENIYPKFNLTKRESQTPLNELIMRLYKKYFFSLSHSERAELIKIKRNYSSKIKEIQNLTLREGYENTGLSQNAISMITFLSSLETDLLGISLFEILGDYYTFDFAYTYTLEGGMSNLALAFYNNILTSNTSGKATFKFGSYVNSIIKSPYNNRIILEIMNLNDNSIYYDEFDYCLCAIPFSSLRRMQIKPNFSVIKMQAINEVNYEIAQKTFMYLKERFWEKNKDKPICGTTLTDLITVSTVYPSDNLVPIENKLFEYRLSEGSSYKEPGVLLASYNWHQNAIRLGSEFKKIKIDDISRCLEIVHKLPDGYIQNNLIDYVSILWSNVPFIWGGVCFMTPGQKQLFLYESSQPEMNNKVFFAGEHVSGKHGWIQGALHSAMIAANNIAYSISRK